MMTTAELLERTGIRDSHTLIRWRKRGLLPDPEEGVHPNGRGRTGLWAEWVVERCLRIRQLVQEGLSLARISEMLGSDWEQEHQRYERQQKLGRYRLGEVTARMDREASARNLAVLVHEKVVPVLAGLGSDPRKALAELDNLLFREETVNRILELARDGCNPVVVYDGGVWRISPDFLVGQVLSRTGKDAKAMVVVPIYSEVAMASSPIIDDLPEKPSISPVARVQQRRGGDVVEHTVHVVGEWDYEIGANS